MKNRSIIKREELCNSLNMNFDEASELFSRETMQSMQMVRVNGGLVLPAGPILLREFGKWLLSVVGASTADHYVKEFLENKNNGSGEQKSITINIEEPNGKKVDVTVTGKNDYIFVNIKDSSVEVKTTPMSGRYGRYRYGAGAGGSW
jgi:hypothetical protein